MKKIILMVATVLACGTAFATGSTPQTTSGAISNQQQGQTAQQYTQAVSQQGQGIEGNTMGNVNYNPVTNVEATKMPAAQAATPVLVSSNDTCMGSTSAGVATVQVGVSFGTTWTDDNCIMLKNSREMFNMGLHAAAVARMCMDKKNLEALELTGYTCPQTLKAQGKPSFVPTAQAAAPIVTPVAAPVPVAEVPVTE